MTQRNKLITTLVIFGPMVLLSYGVSAQFNSLGMDALWGDIPDVAKMYYVLGMLVATIGFFLFTYHVLFKSLEHQKYIWPYLLIFIPSSLWMPLTVYWIAEPSEWLFVLIRFVLILVPIGAYNILKYLRLENQDHPNSTYKVAIWGIAGFIFHTLILDALIWPFYFR